MLSINQLSVRYGSHRVLNDLSLGLEEGRVHGLVGLNGAGKTTLLNTVAGWIFPEEGTITWNGTSLASWHFAYLESDLFFYPYITGYEYLGLFTGQRDKSGTDKWNELFKLPLADLTDTYSHGMKKKIALLAVLLQDRPFLILDEPFNGLDIEASRMISQVIMRLREKNHLILITSHIMESLTGICDYIHLLRDGKIALSATRGNYIHLEEALFGHSDDRNKALLDALL
jgi:ABC-2 type transport system ATP-binding protein